MEKKKEKKQQLWIECCDARMLLCLSSVSATIYYVNFFVSI